MSGKAFLEINGKDIKITKQEDQIVIYFKTTLQFSYADMSSENIRFINPEMLSSIHPQYSTIFKSNIVQPIPPPHESQENQQVNAGQTNRVVAQQTEINVQNSSISNNASMNTGANIIQNRGQSSNPFSRNQNTMINRATNPTNPANPTNPTNAQNPPSTDFRRNIFTTSAQSNVPSQGSRFSQSNNTNFNNNNTNNNYASRGMNSFPYNNSSDQRPQGSQTNVFLAPNTQQTPSIFDQGNSNRGSSSNDRDRGLRNTRNNKVRIN